MDNKQKKNRWFKKLPTKTVFFGVALTAMVCGAMLYATGSEKKYGDLNLDASVDVSDAVLLARYCAADVNVRITLEGLNNADVNLDGYVNASDLTMLLRQIAHLIPMTVEPSESTTVSVETTTETAETTTTTATEETTETTETTSNTNVTSETTTDDAAGETTTTTAVTAETDVTSASDASEMTADTETLPIGVSLSVLTGQMQPDEQLTVNYQAGNIIFSVYAQQPEKTMIAVTFEDTIVGYYRLCDSYTAPAGYTVKEFYDSQSGKPDDLYAILVLRDDVSIDFAQVVNPSEIPVLSKLNYYATNGVRVRNGIPALMWDEEAAKIALIHSQEMADLDYFAHESFDGTSMSQRLEDFGIDWQSCGENVDFGYPDPFSALNGWYNSTEGHREAMLTAKYTRLGVGFATGDIYPGRFYGTQDYWRGWDD